MILLLTHCRVNSGLMLRHSAAITALASSCHTGILPPHIITTQLLSICSRHPLSSRSTPRGLGGWVPQGRCPAQARVSRASEALSVAEDGSRGGPWPPPGRWAARPPPAAGRQAQRKAGRGPSPTGAVSRRRHSRLGTGPGAF